MDNARMRDEIARLVPIDDLVAETVELEAAAVGSRGACPFHPDADRALHVHGEARSYLCYACLRRGDAVGWIMERERMTEPEAVLFLARRAGIAGEG